jgi:tetratricopeptide (TPR) repeat protein
MGQIRNWEVKERKLTSFDNQVERKKLIDEKARTQSERQLVYGNRDYQSALEAYSRALDLCPNGAIPHVYYSNRAAALCYLERYEEAEEDSARSLSLEPTYGKAHQLGLSRFFMGDYWGLFRLTQLL